MEHSPAIKCLGMVTWAITALVSINMLTGMYDYNAIIWIGNQMPSMIVPLCWIIGLSGFISLGMLIKAVSMCGSHCMSCGCSGPCNCKM
jgi:hypothetical protein